MSSISDSNGGFRETLVNSDFSFTHNKQYLIIGKCGSGKTNFIINNIYSKISNEIDNIYLFTSKNNYKYYEKITDIIHDFSYVDLILSNLFKDCESKKTNTLVILDDIININKFKSYEIKKLFYNARHYGITLIVSMQYPCGLMPELRSCFDYVITAQERFLHSYIQRLYEYYFGFYSTLNIFKDVLKTLEDYEFLVFQVQYKNKVGIQKTQTDSNYKFIASKNMEDIIKMNNIQKLMDAKNIIKELNETIDNLVGIRNKLKKLDL